MFMDEGEQIRFRVVEETFVDISPFSGRQILFISSKLFIPFIDDS